MPTAQTLRKAPAQTFASPATTPPAKAKLSAVMLPAIHDAMHPGVYKIALMCWAMFMGIFWITFAASANALFMVVVSTAYAVMFFGVPYVMSRMTPMKAPAGVALLDFLRGRFDTLYGPIGGMDALVQVILIPAALSAGGVAFAFIIHAARLAQ